MSLFFQPDVLAGSHFLDEEESRHCVKVLRFRANDEITVIDGKGHFFQAALQDTNPKHCTFQIFNQTFKPALPYSTHIYIAPTKNLDRMEWMVEKLTEIGIDSVQFVECDHSERRVVKIERLYRKVVSAMKQSGRAYLPTLGSLRPLENVENELSSFSQKFIAHIDDNQKTPLSQSIKPNEKNAVLIGPEGGFSPDEVDWALSIGSKMVSLSDYRLRTETAGVVACQTIHTVNSIFANG